MGVRFYQRSILPTYSLWGREILRFSRQRSRLLGSVGQPALFWILLGAGLGEIFKLPVSWQEVSYLEYLFPGILVLIILFTAIFSTISLIEDRKSGFLQSILVAPVSRSSIALGKMFGGTTLAMLEAVLLLLAIPFLGLQMTWGSLITLLGVLILVAFALTGLGYAIAWLLDSTQGFHSVMNLFLIPMWLLSGAFFPAEGLPSWLSWVMVINPLSYGMELVRAAMYPSAQASLLAWGITVLFAALTLGMAVFLTHQPETGEWRMA